ncbi:hypothetical protein UFOVP612_23 [uncultured Caudovirales phage]|uniref:Uncharacterized protein n=1 Tax=uncultured Caudovirales phage TaxID=2100421 RepID=A0A6J5N245_9CAUD|nr:hypothetical protein UFOVP612_23 [uncultured Caudovirales phage]
MSIIRQIVDSIAETLSDHAFFRTVPKIPVLVEDGKDIETSIMTAMKSAGAFCLVHFESAETDSENTPGPYLSTSQFRVTVSEIPAVWRSKSGKTPSSTEIAEAVARILHHTQPLDKNEDPLSGGVMIFAGLESQTNESMLQKVVSFTIPVGLSNDEPTR